jgi:molybdenum cofactor cytidylyltransferase
MTVGVLVLAAGRASRFGSDKRQALLPDGKRVIDALLQQVIASDLPLLVCLSEDDQRLAQNLDQQHISYCHCTRAPEGMGGTLAEGIGHLPPWNGVLVTLADMPWVKASTYRAITAQLRPEIICVPTWNGKRGHPVGFGARFFQELSQLGGDFGARLLLDKYAGKVYEVAVEDASILRDIDSPADLLSGTTS